METFKCGDAIEVISGTSCGLTGTFLCRYPKKDSTTCLIEWSDGSTFIVHISDIRKRGSESEVDESPDSDQEDDIWKYIDHFIGRTATTTYQTNAPSMITAMANSLMYVRRIMKSLRNVYEYDPEARERLKYLIGYIKDAMKLPNGENYVPVPLSTLDFDGDGRPPFDLVYLWILCVTLYGSPIPSARYGSIVEPKKAIEFLELLIPGGDGSK